MIRFRGLWAVAFVALCAVGSMWCIWEAAYGGTKNPILLAALGGFGLGNIVGQLRVIWREKGEAA